jgi:hypothetical protein
VARQPCCRGNIDVLVAQPRRIGNVEEGCRWDLPRVAYEDVYRV